MRFSKELLALAKSPRIRFRELWLSPGIVDSPHTLDVSVFHSDGHVRFYAVDEDVKLTHGLVDAVLLELIKITLHLLHSLALIFTGEKSMTALQPPPEGLQLLSQEVQMLLDFWAMVLCLGHHFYQVKLDHF